LTAAYETVYSLDNQTDYLMIIFDCNGDHPMKLFGMDGHFTIPVSVDFSGPYANESYTHVSSLILIL
jgi:hypothetical protein